MQNTGFFSELLNSVLLLKLLSECASIVSVPSFLLIEQLENNRSNNQKMSVHPLPNRQPKLDPETEPEWNQKPEASARSE